MAAADNMALDEALLDRARRSGESVMRVYAWSGPTLSLGRNQRGVGVYDAGAAAARGVSIVRRLTGGRAVLHDREVTYSVTAPTHDASGVRSAYAAINQVLLAALRALGVAASLAEPNGRTPRPGSAPCFEIPVAGEIVVGERKLVGSAQLSEAGAFLQHGSILVDDAQSLVAELAAVAVPRTAAAATLRGSLGWAPGLDEVAAAIFAALREHCAGRVKQLALDAELVAAAAQARGRYLSDAWTWRR
ncbi:MAG: lipoate--protein ligase family protein [Gemmatimonadaceae bacterium]